MTSLQVGALEIRVATEADAAAMLEIYAPIVRETAISFEAAPPSAGAWSTSAGDSTSAPWPTC